MSGSILLKPENVNEEKTNKKREEEEEIRRRKRKRHRLEHCKIPTTLLYQLDSGSGFELLLLNI